MNEQQEKPKPFVASYVHDPSRLVVVNGTDLYDVSRVELAEAWLESVRGRGRHAFVSCARGVILEHTPNIKPKEVTNGTE